VAILLFLSPFSMVIKDKIQLQTSGFFSKSESKEYKPQAHQFSLPPSEIKPMKEVEEQTTLVAAKEIESSFAVADTTKVIAPIVQAVGYGRESTFTLISGCFAIVENAEKQVEQLKQKNINANIIGKTKNGLYRVGCGTFNSPNEANTALMSLKAQDTEVWVLKN
jgi:cell division protein FtsN